MGTVKGSPTISTRLFMGSPPLFVFPGSLMLGTGSWDSCALSADILGRVVFRGVTSHPGLILILFSSGNRQIPAFGFSGFLNTRSRLGTNSKV